MLDDTEISRLVRAPMILLLVGGHIACAPRRPITEPSQPGNTMEQSVATPEAGDDNANSRARLTALQYHVTQECGTEPPFDNAYWNHHEPGIYVDVVSGKPLFSSLDKFDSGTGWPSFTRPIASAEIITRADTSSAMTRTEVRSKHANSHLGHVFDDGPGETGLRYCINSAALRFVPVSGLASEGYSQYLSLFTATASPPVTRDVNAHDRTTLASTPASRQEVALLAAGCFWGVQEILRKLPGVSTTMVGYVGGALPNPTYDNVSTGRTGHAEAVRVVFDPARLSYAELLRHFFRLHDPTTPNQQGHDIGTQYRSAIFYADEQQRLVAERVKSEVEKSGKWHKPLVTEIVSAATFYSAEESHQDYLVKHPGGYTCHYLRD